MLLEKWKELSLSEQTLLTQKYGITRMGLNNDVTEEGLQKIAHILVPAEVVEEQEEPVKEVKVKKTRKSKK